MATIHCKNDPGLWGWGAEEETEAVLFGASEASLPLFHTNEKRFHTNEKRSFGDNEAAPGRRPFFTFSCLSRFHARLRAPRRLTTTAKAPP